MKMLRQGVVGATFCKGGRIAEKNRAFPSDNGNTAFRFSPRQRRVCKNKPGSEPSDKTVSKIRLFTFYRARFRSSLLFFLKYSLFLGFPFCLVLLTQNSAKKIQPFGLNLSGRLRPTGGGEDKLPPCLLKILHRKIFFGKNAKPLRGFPSGGKLSVKQTDEGRSILCVAHF